LRSVRKFWSEIRRGLVGFSALQPPAASSSIAVGQNFPKFLLN